MKNLKYYLKKTLNDYELELIDDLWLSREINLEQVKDIEKFIEECDSECAEFKKAGPHRKQDWDGARAVVVVVVIVVARSRK